MVHFFKKVKQKSEPNHFFENERWSTIVEHRRENHGPFSKESKPWFSFLGPKCELRSVFQIKWTGSLFKESEPVHSYKKVNRSTLLRN